MINRYLELNPDGVVINIIVWDGESPYNPEGHTLMLCDDHPSVSFGWTFDGVGNGHQLVIEDLGTLS